MLRSLCGSLGVPYSDRMLWWPPGRRATDGIWARHWYDRVEHSSAFEPLASGPEADPDAVLSPALAAIEAQCRPLYERLRQYRLRA
jgi:hypothetical protein